MGLESARKQLWRESWKGKERSCQESCEQQNSIAYDLHIPKRYPDVQDLTRDLNDVPK